MQKKLILNVGLFILFVFVKNYDTVTLMYIVMYLFMSATRASLKACSFSASYLIVNLFCIIIPYAFSSILSEVLGDFAYLSR